MKTNDRVMRGWAYGDYWRMILARGHLFLITHGDVSNGHPAHAGQVEEYLTHAAYRPLSQQRVATAWRTIKRAYRRAGAKLPAPIDPMLTKGTP